MKNMNVRDAAKAALLGVLAVASLGAANAIYAVPATASAAEPAIGASRALDTDTTSYCIYFNGTWICW